ncbi:hypothetical protein U5922_002520 [Aquicoccus sp. G2-2]|uniref:hypothetical protein n=1 Tax=Aquicoccus sp. G2-2 TaxID=3092120 RepID=UPI002ADF897F|nr:hypothetical protein [Aquicoccus sp. G2-2]MEA1112396.1 hypothetical protein [Aquicoccus sp. G2-2]
MILPLVAVVIVFVVMVVFRNRETRLCRWRLQTSDPTNLDTYKCMYCGASAESKIGAPPVICHDPRRNPQA